jgi:hypothetical protein
MELEFHLYGANKGFSEGIHGLFYIGNMIRTNKLLNTPLITSISN